MDARPDVAGSTGESPVRRKPEPFNATVCSAVAVGLGQYLKLLGLDGASVLKAAGLNNETLSQRYSRFPVEQLAAVFKISARQRNNPFFGLHFGEWYRPRILNACNFAVNSAPDLRNALISLQDHHNLVAGIPTRLSDRGAIAELSWIVKSASFHPRQVIDFKTIRTLKLFQQATGPEWRPLRVNLAYERPENLSEYFQLLGPNVHFDQPVNSFWIDFATLAIPMPDADPDIYYMARNSSRNPFPCKQDDEDPVNQLRQFISAQLDKNDITLATASKHMGMTQQQLRRLMKKHKTCFQCVLNDTRKAHAAHYLCETGIQFSEITYLLGFSDQSVFTRAVRRWFGTTPKDMRRAGHEST